MGGVARATHTHRSGRKEGACYAHHDVGGSMWRRNVFQLHGADARGRAVLSRRVKRQPVVGGGGEPAGLRDRDGGVRECASLGSGG